MTLMDFFMAALLALFLSVPVGPVGFAAGEQMMLGKKRDFLLIAVGCILADVVLAVLALLLISLVPSFDPQWFYGLWWIWLLVGALMVGMGVYLWRNLPTRKERAQGFTNPFGFGFGLTLIWPTSFLGITGAFMAAHVAGWLPHDLGQSLWMAPSLGVGTTVLWVLWGAGCLYLSRQKRWKLTTLANVFHRGMAGSVVLGGLALFLKPLGF